MPLRGDRRGQKRLPLSAEAMLCLVLPEEAVTQKAFRGVATDISGEGLRIKTFQVERDQFLLIRRYINITCEVLVDLPYLTEPLQLHGVIVWLHYGSSNSQEAEHCSMGIRLENNTAEASRRLQHVLCRLRGDSYDATPSAERVEKV